MKTTVVNIKKTDVWNVFIGRPSKWGNPFKIRKNVTREEVIERYRAYILEDKYLLSCLPQLKGKILGCYCSPLPCHGDVLISLIEEKSDV